MRITRRMKWVHLYDSIYVSCTIPLRISYGRYDASLVDSLWEDERLAHSLGHKERCSDLTPEDTVDCFYLFGTTLLHQKHLFGECSYLLLKENK